MKTESVVGQPVLAEVVDQVLLDGGKNQAWGLNEESLQLPGLRSGVRVGVS